MANPHHMKIVLAAGILLSLLGDHHRVSTFQVSCGSNTQFDPCYNHAIYEGFEHTTLQAILYRGTLHVVTTLLRTNDPGQSMRYTVTRDYLHWEERLNFRNTTQILPNFFLHDHRNTSGRFPSGVTPGFVFGYYTLNGTVHGIDTSVDEGRTWRQSCTGCGDMKVYASFSVEWNDYLHQWCGLREYFIDNFVLSPDLQHWTNSTIIDVELQRNHYYKEVFKVPLARQPRVSRWVFIVRVTNQLAVHTLLYYIGTLTDVYTGQIGPINFDYGHDTFEVAAADDIRYREPLYPGNAFTIRPERLVIVVCRNSYFNRTEIDVTWSEMYTSPRIVTLENTSVGLRLLQKPAANLWLISGRFHQFFFTSVTPNGPNPLSRIRGRSFLLQAEIWTSPNDGFEFRLRQNGNQSTLVGFDGRNSVYVDRTNSGFPSYVNQEKYEDYASRTTADAPVKRAGTRNKLKIYILVDTSNVEVFFGDGEVVFTEYIFPNADSNGMALVATGNSPIYVLRMGIKVFTGA